MVFLFSYTTGAYEFSVELCTTRKRAIDRTDSKGAPGKLVLLIHRYVLLILFPLLWIGTQIDYDFLIW